MGNRGYSDLSLDDFVRCAPPGWKSLTKMVWELAQNIEYLHITDVKEKFGGLRIYLYGSEWALDLMLALEEASFHICEVCGKSGEIRENRRWYKTLCDEHNNMWMYGNLYSDDYVEGYNV